MKRIKIGRNQTNDVVISNPVVSGEHALLTVMDDGSVMIKDMSSKNGTYVNSVRISDTTPLRPGDVVKLGDSVLDWQNAIKRSDNTVVNQAPKPGVPTGTKEYRTIGRNQESQIRFSYNDVSGQHAFLCRMLNDDVKIFDNGSTNGTFVNGERITSRVLHQGDIVMIANKYQLNWTSYFQPMPTPDSTPRPTPTPDSNKKKKLAFGIIGGVAAAIIVVLALWLNRPWDERRVYDYYKNSIVLVFKTTDCYPEISGMNVVSFMGILGFDENDFSNQFSSFASGTGSFISYDGKILTNRHMTSTDEEVFKAEAIDRIMATVRKHKDVEREFVEQLAEYLKENLTVTLTTEIHVGRNDTHISSISDLFPCQVIKVSEKEEIDAAIIQLNTKRTPEDVKHIVDINRIPKNLKIGSKLFTIGFPAGLEIGTTQVGLEATIQSGTMTQDCGDFNYQHNLRTIGGASGSPMFDNHGRFAGLHFSGTYMNGVSLGYSYAVKPERVQEFFNKMY